MTILKAKCTQNTKWDGFPSLSAPSSQLALQKAHDLANDVCCVSTLRQPSLLPLQQLTVETHPVQWRCKHEVIIVSLRPKAAFLIKG